MDLKPVDLPELVAVTLGTLTLLIPIMGATLRFAAKPLIDALLQAGVLGSRMQGAHEVELARLSLRVLELEHELGRQRIEGPALTEPALGAVGELRRLRT